jgi:hypothetical protein
MTLVILNDKLEPQSVTVDVDKFAHNFDDRPSRWEADSGKQQTLFHVHNNIPDDVSMLHQNYLEYLQACYASHLPAILSPDIIWYTVSCELASIVKDDPDAFRDLFTDSDEKQEIRVQSDSLIEMPMNDLINALRCYVPTDMDTFLPEFSTTTDRSRIARSIAFADMVSPYYDYCMFCCGIPAIRITGTSDDWKLLVKQWEKIKKIFVTAKPSLVFYMQKVDNILNKIKDQFFQPDTVWLKSIFYTKRCGSGSDEDVFGWFTDLLLKQPEGIRKISNFSTHISEIEYLQLATQQRYVMKSGVLFSMFDEFAVPEFGNVILEKRE